MNELEIKELLAGFINHLNSLGEDLFIRESEIQDFLLKKPEVIKVVTERFPIVKCLDKFGAYKTMYREGWLDEFFPK